jgi:hypothetical protein
MSPTEFDETGAIFGRSFLGTGSRNKIAKLAGSFQFIFYIHGLCGKFPNVQNSPPLRRPSGARQVLLSSNEFDELRRENRIALSCLVIVLCFFM